MYGQATLEDNDDNDGTHITDENHHTNTPYIPEELLPTHPFGAVGVASELVTEAHSDVTQIIIAHADNDYSIADELVFTMTFVDDSNDELVILLDPILLSLGLNYDSGDIEDILGTEDVSIKVLYGVYIPEDGRT